MKLALEGIRVLDLTIVRPGAFCTMILADYGAEVLKIEAPLNAGYRVRRARVSSEGEKGRRQAAYDALNRNKKSIELNLKSEAGQQAFYRLAETADVIVEGFRPGTVKRLGVDYETISKLNPGIVYCSMSGYGQDGPYHDLPGHDVNYIAMAGALGLNGRSDSPPVIPINLIADFAGASLHAVMGILIALVARDKIGKGQYIDIAYTDTVISLLGFLTCDYFHSGAIPKRGEHPFQGANPYYGVYETKDGKYISIGCLETWFWENLCRALGKEEYIPYHYASEHRFKKPEGDKWEEISSYLRQVFLTRTRDEWFQFLAKKDVPVGKVYSLDEVFSDPQVRHREMMVEIDDPALGRIKQVGFPIKFSETPGKVRSLSPMFGEHTSEVLQKLGYSPEEMQDLRRAGVIG